MIGSVQMLCGMGFILGLAGLVFGPNRKDAFWLVACCGAVWWFLACVFGAETPE